MRDYDRLCRVIVLSWWHAYAPSPATTDSEFHGPRGDRPIRDYLHGLRARGWGSVPPRWPARWSLDAHLALFRAMPVGERPDRKGRETPRKRLDLPRGTPPRETEPESARGTELA
jgi:hypothetical protein